MTSTAPSSYVPVYSEYALAEIPTLLSTTRCGLCPPPHDGKFIGVPANVHTHQLYCTSSDIPHYYHETCFRTYIRTLLMNNDMNGVICPGCNSSDDNEHHPHTNTIKHDDDNDDDEVKYEFAEASQVLGGKMRVKYPYTAYVYVRDARIRSANDSSKKNKYIVYTSVMNNSDRTRAVYARESVITWSHGFVFTAMLNKRQLDAEAIVFRVEKHVRLWSNTYIGSVVIGVKDILATPSHEIVDRSYPLLNSRGGDGGDELRVSVRIVSPGDDHTNVPTFFTTTTNTPATLYNNDNDDDDNDDEAEEEQKYGVDDESVELCIYRGEMLSSGSKAYVQVMSVGMKAENAPRTMNTTPGEWNSRFMLPPTQRLRIRIMEPHTLRKDAVIGETFIVCAVAASDTPKWLHFYDDVDGCAPEYRGRILYTLRQRSPPPIKKAVVSACTKADAPTVRHCRVEFDVRELVVDKSLAAAAAAQFFVTFSWGRNFNAPRATTAAASNNERTCSSIKGGGGGGGGVHCFREPITLVTEMPEYDAPDIIIYVHTAAASPRDSIVGYLRVPVSGQLRETENWEHGDDLTLVERLWSSGSNNATNDDNNDDGTRSYALTDVKELYDAWGRYIMMRLRLSEGADFTPYVRPPSSETTIPRQLCRVTLRVLQAVDLAATQDNGLSCPQVSITCPGGFKMLQTRSIENTLHPCWMETLEAEVMLPVDLRLAPPLQLNIHHETPPTQQQQSWLWWWLRPAHKRLYLGRASVACLPATTPQWYDIVHGEETHGRILFHHQIQPADKVALVPLIPRQRIDVKNWKVLSITFSAFDLIGDSVRAQLKKSDAVPSFVFESWDYKDTFTPASFPFVDPLRLTLPMHMPSESYYESALHVKVMNSRTNLLLGVATIKANDVLSITHEYSRFVDNVLMRMFRKLSLRWAFQHLALPSSSSSPLPSSPRHHITAAGTTSSPHKPLEHRHSSRFTMLHVDTQVDAEMRSDATLAFIPIHRVDARNGTELLPSGWAREWEPLTGTTRQQQQSTSLRLRGPYEQQPRVLQPFATFPIYRGAHNLTTAVEQAQQLKRKTNRKLSARRVVIGQLRAAVQQHDEGKVEVATTTPVILDVERFKQPRKYLIRVYLLQCDLYTNNTAGGKQRHRARDVYVRAKCRATSQTTPVVYDHSSYLRHVLEFLDVTLVSAEYPETWLYVDVWNKGGLFGDDLMGSTRVNLEQRALSLQYQRQRPIVERRSLYSDDGVCTGTIELCVDVLDMQDVLKEPVRPYLFTSTIQHWTVECSVRTLSLFSKTLTNDNQASQSSPPPSSPPSTPPATIRLPWWRRLLSCGCSSDHVSSSSNNNNNNNTNNDHNRRRKNMENMREVSIRCGIFNHLRTQEDVLHGHVMYVSKKSNHLSVDFHCELPVSYAALMNGHTYFRLQVFVDNDEAVFAETMVRLPLPHTNDTLLLPEQPPLVLRHPYNVNNTSQINMKLGLIPAAAPAVGISSTPSSPKMNK